MWMQNADLNQPNSSLSIISIPVNPPQANQSQNPKRLMRNSRLSLITVILCLVDEKVRENLVGKGRIHGYCRFPMIICKFRETNRPLFLMFFNDVFPEYKVEKHFREFDERFFIIILIFRKQNYFLFFYKKKYFTIDSFTFLYIN
jgi:hypothetical protein